jgi:hypothetical protein
MMSEDHKTLVYFLQRIVDELENITDALNDHNIISDKLAEHFLDDY